MATPNGVPDRPLPVKDPSGSITTPVKPEPTASSTYLFVAAWKSGDSPVGSPLRISAPVIVMVSSGMGSLAVTTDPSRFESTLVSVSYTSSKAALNMITTQYAKAFPAMRINAVDPGYTGTDFNQHRGTQTVEEGAEIIVRMASIGPDGPTGGYFSAAGTVPW